MHMHIPALQFLELFPTLVVVVVVVVVVIVIIVIAAAATAATALLLTSLLSSALFPLATTATTATTTTTAAATSTSSRFELGESCLAILELVKFLRAQIPFRLPTLQISQPVLQGRERLRSLAWVRVRVTAGVMAGARVMLRARACRHGW